MNLGLCECGCGKSASRRFLPGHNFRRRDHEPLYVVDANGCWIWQWSKDHKGYGLHYRDGRYDRAHRVAYERANGPIPEGLVLDHLCRVKACVNPSHLEAVEVATNNRRGLLAKLTADDVRAIRRSTASNVVMADVYGVTLQNIRRIRKRETWRDIS